MSRLASFLTALWLSSAAAHPGLTLKQVTTGVTSDFQAVVDPLEKTVAFIGDGVCNNVKPLLGVGYDNYDDKEPDMSKLTLVFMNSAKTVIYNLTEAPEELPKETWFNSELSLKIYLHGFTDNPMKDSFQTMRSAFFDQEASTGHVNILALDASSLISYFYLRASTLVKFIGEKLGEVLAALVPAGLDPQNVHLIGHSLGSHIAASAGKKFYELTGSRVGRISGLDPAGPCFGKLDATLRLSKEDADFVDVIHTDAGVFGLNQEVGHADYWPNSGSEQPNCGGKQPGCSHSRAWEYFAESVRTPEKFVAVKCNSSDDFRLGKCDYNDTSVMGYGTPANTRGSYYCQTYGEEPYAAGAMGLKYNETSLVRFVTNAVKDAL